MSVVVVAAEEYSVVVAVVAAGEVDVEVAVLPVTGARIDMGKVPGMWSHGVRKMFSLEWDRFFLLLLPAAEEAEEELVGARKLSRYSLTVSAECCWAEKLAG